MNYAEAAEVIKSTVEMRDVAEMFGHTVGRGGFMICPFHGDHDASLKIYDRKGRHSGWHCFGCGRGGSVIDFVMEHERCNFQRAVRMINDGMGLGLMTVSNMFQQNLYNSQQRIFDKVRAAMDDIIDLKDRQIEDEQRFLTKWLQLVEDRQYPDMVLVHSIEEAMKYNDYMAEKVEELRREVSEWRSRARRGSQ